MSTTPPEPTSLPSPPTDGITGLSYLPSSSLLASSSWDGGLRIHDTSKQEHLTTHAMESGPLLSLSACPAAGGSTGGAVYAGAIDGSVRRYDVETSAASTVGMHSADVSEANRLLSGEVKVAASCVGAVDANLVASAGWDGKFHVWDARLSGGKRNAAAASIDLPGKAFSMDVTGDGTRAVVATSGRRNVFVDIRAGSVSDKENGGDAAEVILDRESSLKYQTRVVRFFPDARAIAVGSIEGRVAIEFLDDIGIKSGKKKYAFKCHRVNDTIYPVNAIAFHPILGTFATGGADGTVVTWDGQNKKKLSGIAKCPTSVSALAFNHDGTQIAMASSYTFEEGDRDHPRDEILVRDVLEGEVRPKTKK